MAINPVNISGSSQSAIYQGFSKNRAYAGKVNFDKLGSALNRLDAEKKAKTQAEIDALRFDTSGLDQRARANIKKEIESTRERYINGELKDNEFWTEIDRINEDIVFYSGARQGANDLVNNVKGGTNIVIRTDDNGNPIMESADEFTRKFYDYRNGTPSEGEDVVSSLAVYEDFSSNVRPALDKKKAGEIQESVLKDIYKTKVGTENDEGYKTWYQTKFLTEAKTDEEIKGSDEYNAVLSAMLPYWKQEYAVQNYEYQRMQSGTGGETPKESYFGGEENFYLSKFKSLIGESKEFKSKDKTRSLLREEWNTKGGGSDVQPSNFGSISTGISKLYRKGGVAEAILKENKIPGTLSKGDDIPKEPQFIIDNVITYHPKTDRKTGEIQKINLPNFKGDLLEVAYDPNQRSYYILGRRDVGETDDKFGADADGEILKTGKSEEDYSKPIVNKVTLNQLKAQLSEDQYQEILKYDLREGPFAGKSEIIVKAAKASGKTIREIIDEYARLKEEESKNN